MDRVKLRYFPRRALSLQVDTRKTHGFVSDITVFLRANTSNNNHFFTREAMQNLYVSVEYMYMYIVRAILLVSSNVKDKWSTQHLRARVASVARLEALDATRLSLGMVPFGLDFTLRLSECVVYVHVC